MMWITFRIACIFRLIVAQEILIFPYAIWKWLFVIVNN